MLDAIDPAAADKAAFETPFLKALVFLAILFIMWIRWTLPRFRYDQLMDLAWKSMIPLALINLVATAGIVQLVRTYWN